MSRKTTIATQPPTGRHRDAHGFLRDPRAHPWAHRGTELAVVEAFTRSERRARLCHAALNACGPHVPPAHKPRPGSRAWLQEYVKPIPPSDADVRDVASHLRTASLHFKKAPVVEVPAKLKPKTWPFATPPSGVGLALLYCSPQDVCAVSATGKGWTSALETYAVKRVGFWAPLPHETAPSFCLSIETLRATRHINSVQDCVSRGSAAHLSVVLSRGRVLGCGRNDGGQRGDASIGQGPQGWPICRDVAHLEGIVAVATGAEHTNFLDADGRVLECGRAGGREGSKGPDGDRRPCRFRPEPVVLARRVLQIAAGDDFTICLTTRGELFSWGRGDFGELGAGVRVRRDPGPCETGERFARISAGPRHVLAASKTGRLYAWGSGDDGATGFDENSWRPRRVELVPGAVTDVSAGAAHSLVLVRGAVHALGRTRNGRAGVPCGNPPVERAVADRVRGLPPDIVRVEAGGEHSLCLTENGDVYAWGRGGRAGQRSPRDAWAPALVSLGARAVAISAHAAHTVVALDDGSFWAFGSGDHGRLGALDQFGRSDPRDKALPVRMDLPGPPPARLKPHEYFGETERRYANRD